MNNPQTLKSKVRKACIQILDNKIAIIEAGIEQAQRDANTQTKSSAGDKHETGRAMMHLEQERKARQLSGLLQERNKLMSLRISASKSVRNGSLVHTDLGTFYISISAGELELEGSRIKCISLASPLGQELEECEEGDVVHFRGRDVHINWVQ